MSSHRKVAQTAHDHPHARFNLSHVAGLVGARGQHTHAVVYGELVIGAIQIGLIATGAVDARAGIIRDDPLRNALKQFQGADVGADPVFQFLTRAGFRISVIAGTQDSHKDGGLTLWPPFGS